MKIVSKIKASKLRNRSQGLHANRIVRDTFYPKDERQADFYVKTRTAHGWVIESVS